MITPDVHKQTSSPEAQAAPAPNTNTPRLTVRPLDDSIIEGGVTRFLIERHDVQTTACSVRWRSLSDFDIIVGPTSAVVNFNPGILAIQVDLLTTTLPATQGERFVTLTLSNPVGCIIDPAAVSAQIRILDEVADPTIYVNGFSNRVRIRMPVLGSDLLTGALFWFNDTLPDLKAVANLGKIQKATAQPGPLGRIIPYDLRFEIGGDVHGQGGVKISHRVKHYDPTTGLLITTNRIASPIDLEAEFDVWLYFGNANVTVTEEDLAGVSADHLAWWTFPEGIDMTGAHSLTLAGPTVGTLLGPAASWNNADETATNPNAAFLSGHSQLSVWSYQTNLATNGVFGDDRGMLLQGAPGAGNANAGLILGKVATSPSGTPQAWFAQVKCQDGLHFGYGESNAATSAPQFVGASRSPGQPWLMVIDGKLQAVSASAARTGLTAMTAGQPVGVGTNATNILEWRGMVAEVGVMSRSLTAEAWLLFQRSLIAPHDLYGLGAIEGPASGLSLVAMPATRTTTSTGAIDVDVLSLASVPVGQTANITLLRNPTGGTFNIVAKQIRFTPTAGFNGKARCEFELTSSAGHISWSTLTVDVNVPLTTMLDLAANAPSIVESGGQAVFTVTRSVNLAVTSSVVWTKSGTTDNGDFSPGQLFSGTLTFAPSEATKTITFNILNDLVVEANKTINVTLSSPVNATIGNAAATIVLLDDDVTSTNQFAKLMPMIGFTRPDADIIRPNFTNTSSNFYTTTGPNKTLDLRGRVGIQHQIGQGPSTKCRATLHAGSVVTGMTTRSVQTPWAMPYTWKERHGNEWANDKGIRIDSISGDVTFEGISLDGAGIDGIGTPTETENRWTSTFNGLHAVDIGDDVDQNDSYKRRKTYNFYLQGHTILSQRPGSGSTPLWENVITVYEHGLMHLKRQPHDTDEKGTPTAFGSKRVGPFISPTQQNSAIVGGTDPGWAHKWFWKTEDLPTGGVALRLQMKWVLMRIDTIPVEGVNKCTWPPIGDGVGPGSVNGSLYENVTVIWLGGGDWPFPPVPPGVTIITDINAGYTLWKAEEKKWMELNGCPLLDGKSFSWTKFTAATPRAFPTARGYGAFHQGGAGGEVKLVTNLDNDGPGSFREACRGNDPRIVRFNAAGTINLATDLLIGNPFITIQGETAPSPGITVTGSPIMIKTSNVIVTHIASRPGNLLPGAGFDNRDALQIEHANNVLIDHCSFSWSVDECLTGWFEDTDLITVQWCIIAEPMWNAGHSKGSHPMGMLFGRGTGNVSIHHNLFAQVGFRSPEISSGVRCDIVNNVIYNWGQRGTTISSGDKDYLGPSFVNIVNNVYKPGAHSLPANEGRIITGMGTIAPVGYQVYINGNIDHLGASANTSNGTDLSMVVANPVGGGVYDVPVDAASGLFNAILTGAGRMLPIRDAVDTRIVNDTTNGIARKAHSMADIASWG